MTVNYNLEQFSSVDLYRKAVLIFHDGNLMMEHTDNEILCQLFFIQNFYVEVIIDRKSQRVINIHGFRNGRNLDKYLSKVKLPM